MKPRILIVDDEKEFADIVAKALAKRGFDVKSAYSLDSALEALEGVDLLVSDFNMPNMEGIKLVGRAMELNPSQRIVVVVDSPPSGHLEELEGLEFIVKPFSIGRLVELITKSLRKGHANR